MIDWRRSASSDHLYVREREWEAAHTFCLWPDLSPSMDFTKPSGASDEARPRDCADAGLGRAAGARRRARRAAWLDEPNREPQGDHAHRRDDPGNITRRPRCMASLPPKARLKRFSGAHPVRRFPRPDRTRHASASRARRRRRGRASGADPRSRGGNVALRGPHRIPDARTVLNAGLQIASRASREAIAAARSASRRACFDRTPARLDVSGASHRPAGVRAAAVARDAAAGRRRGSPLEGMERAAAEAEAQS